MTNYDIIKALGFKEVKDGIHTAYEYAYGSGIHTISIQPVDASYSKTTRPLIIINDISYHILDRASMTYLEIKDLLSCIYRSGVNSGMCEMEDLWKETLSKIEIETRHKI